MGDCFVGFVCALVNTVKLVDMNTLSSGSLEMKQN